MNNQLKPPDLSYNILLLRFHDKRIDREFTEFYHGDPNISIILVDIIVLVGWSILFIEDIYETSSTYMWVRIAIRCSILVVILVCAVLLILPKITKRLTNIILFVNVLSLAMLLTALEAVTWVGLASRSSILPLAYTPYLLGKLVKIVIYM